MTIHAPKEIAAAVQGHVKALRLLGRHDTCIAAIADALHLTDDAVKTAFEGFKIMGATVETKRFFYHVRHGTTQSPAITLKRYR